MKKLFLLFVLFLGLQGFAQKTVYLFNFSPYSIDIGEIGTHHTSAAWPRFNTFTPSLVNIPSGQSYTLENTSSATKFPFDSPASVPVYTQWARRNSATSGIVVNSSVAYTVGSTQVFDHIKFQVGPAGSKGGATMFASTNGTPNTYDDPVNGWGVMVEADGDTTIITIY